jgi:hypothetical protein
VVVGPVLDARAVGVAAAGFVAGLAGWAVCSAGGGATASGSASCGAPLPAVAAVLANDPAIKPANRMGEMLFIDSQIVALRQSLPNLPDFTTGRLKYLEHYIKIPEMTTEVLPPEHVAAEF